MEPSRKRAVIQRPSSCSKSFSCQERVISFFPFKPWGRFPSHRLFFLLHVISPIHRQQRGVYRFAVAACANELRPPIVRTAIMQKRMAATADFTHRAIRLLVKLHPRQCETAVHSLGISATIPVRVRNTFSAREVRPLAHARILSRMSFCHPSRSGR